jgi:hypothetical protein
MPDRGKVRLMKILAALILALLSSACAATPAPKTPDQQVEAFMWDYTKTWNRHDASAIAKNFYRQGPTVEAQTASLAKTFADMKAQGYDKSDIHEIKGCITGPDTAWAGMKFTRLKTDGAPLGPKDRASSYDLKKFPDGWRIVKLKGWDAAMPLACPKA